MSNQSPNWPGSAPPQFPAPQPQAAPFQQPQPQYQQPPAPAAMGGGDAMQRAAAILAGAKQGNASGRYLPPGDYVVDVTTAEIKDTRKGLAFIVGFAIVESDNNDVKVGDDSYSYFRSFQDEWGNMGANDIKDWICRWAETQGVQALGTQWETPTQDGSTTQGHQVTCYVAGEQQPARGSRWHVRVWQQPKKRSAGLTTKTAWQALELGASLGLTPSQRSAAPAAPQQAPRQSSGSLTPPQAPAAPAPAMFGPPPGPVQPPQAWPQHTPWPGQQGGNGQ